MSARKAPAAKPLPAPEVSVSVVADRRTASLDRLSERLDEIKQALDVDAPETLRETEHSCLCLTCGNSFEMSGGCSEDRPSEVVIPFETMLELSTLANDTDHPAAEVGARLISIGLYVLGRGGWRERHDMIELWEVAEERPRTDAAPEPRTAR